ncbi:MAG: PepSY domain-containing protein [Beijerinckiaceae bacterium]|nr:PepSY domain-containing protein [Beijerinckiaceae bacterium]
MLRRLHAWPGLIAGLLVFILALTGAVLSIDPALEWARAAPVVAGTTSVASLADSVKARHDQIDKIVRTASGSVIVSYFDGDQAGAERVDPATGQALGRHETSGFTRFVTNLHRSLLLDATGRALAGAAAVAMAFLTISGAMMLAARQGGWTSLLRPIRGDAAQRWHSELGRLAMLCLMLTALSGTYLSLADFEFVPDGSSISAGHIQGSGAARTPVGQLRGLLAFDVADMRDLSFPYETDLTDSYTLTTSQAVIEIDAATGEILSTQPHSTARRIYEAIYMLHTGQGLWPLGLLLGLAALGVPVFAGTGLAIWLARRRATPQLRDNIDARLADTILLVGSEGNSTWGFAGALHAALTDAGHRVHTGAMNSLARNYPKAARLLILTSTYGAGVAPASARRFLARLDAATATLPVAVLGFGDRSFPGYCRYAEDVAASLEEKSFPILIPLERIDRQSTQSFEQWGRTLGEVLGQNLSLSHVVARPSTFALELKSRSDYGADVQAPTAVLRFGPPDTNEGAWRRMLHRPSLPAFEAGDLVGILPPGENAPRFYSLASTSTEGLLEICVRKQNGGLCSTFLHDLSIGDGVDAFIRLNPAFHPNRSKAPLILIGAGAGIGPLIGFIRRNDARRPVHLYWGGRSPASDFLYESELQDFLGNGRLSVLRTAFSRAPGGGYVQDSLAADGAAILDLVRSGAQIMVCGGRGMAAGVAAALDASLTPAGLDLGALKESFLYVEDVY